jgi:hypothetical protein
MSMRGPHEIPDDRNLGSRRSRDPIPLSDGAGTTATLRAEGVVEQLLLRADGAGGYIIMNADSEDDARRHLQELPFVQQSIMRFELTEIKA